MAIIDYRGFRLTCLSALPINENTLIYGSKDGGKTVYEKNEQFNQKMKIIGEKLNICGHLVKGSLKTNHSNEATIYGPGDIEGYPLFPFKCFHLFLFSDKKKVI